MERRPKPSPSVRRLCNFNDLPQEVTDLIFEFYREQRRFSLAYEKEYTGHGKRYEFKMKISETTLVPYYLDVPHDYKKGFTALQVVSSNGPEYDAFRAKVTKISLGTFDGKTRIASSLNHAYNLIAARFPNLQEATIRYRSYRQVYQCYSDFSTTPEWQAPDFVKHREGAYDGEMMYPPRKLRVAGLASALAERDKGHVQTYLDHCCVWNAKGRGVYCWQTIKYLVTTQDVIAVEETI